MDILYQQLIDDCNNELQAINKWINTHPVDANIKYLVSYSIIKACGTIELVFKQMIFDALSVNSNEEARSYMETHIIDSSCNPSTGAIGKMIEQFSGAKASQFNDSLIGKTEKSDLNSLVTLRNDIAHGRTNSPTIKTVIRYFESGVTILAILSELL